jgi:hypothetical protein
VLHSINPRNHGPITAWLAGAQVARAVSLELEGQKGVREG